MQFRYFRGVLRQYENEVHRVRSGDRKGPDLLDRARLMRILRRALEDRLEARGILELFVRVWVLMSLEGWNGMICTELSAHFGENCYC